MAVIRQNQYQLHVYYHYYACQIKKIIKYFNKFFKKLIFKKIFLTNYSLEMFKTILTNIKTKNKVLSYFTLNNSFGRTYSSVLELKTKYSLPESNKILETINDNTADDLSKYLIFYIYFYYSILFEFIKLQIQHNQKSSFKN